MFCARIALSLLVGLAVASPVWAGLKLEFEANEQVSDSFEISSPGQILPIRVFLRQVFEYPLEPDLLTTGLIGARFDVRLASPEIAKFEDATPNPLWDLEISPIAVNSTGDTANANLFAGERAVPAVNDRVFLATFFVKGIAIGQTTISASEFSLDPDEVDFMNDELDPLDSFIDYPIDDQGQASPFTAKITVNPEPGSLALSLLIAGGGAVVAAVRRRRQRRLSTDGDQAESTAS